ncbi:dihydroorotase [Psychroflexus salis]|uniref:Dihydroorotase n=1 Tax=Psychroflexus salis TaxID=1526574 RepID=A0A917A051_9FLAO|nr:dihydroorotase [Psychroflexus salis]GGE20888.1 dihydroorotase [Psychroflexus salis]
MKTLIKNAKIVNENSIFDGDVYIDDQIIKEISSSISLKSNSIRVIDAEGKYLLPGLIDDQVHFREPGLTHKETIKTGSISAAAGGITSFIEMPNTNPQSTTLELLEKKFAIAEKDALVNYSFMFGGTNTNLEEIKKINPKTIAGLKLFLGSSTGNMLVDNEKALEEIFKNSPVIISTHCEDEATIQKNTQLYIEKYGEENIPISAHPEIRSEEACYLSSSKAIKLAKKTGARLHVFHLSTAKELTQFSNKIPLKNKKITAEVCIHHLWFNDKDYDKKGTKIKWNPAVKSEKDQKALLKALNEDYIDVLATDHAPHTLAEKNNNYLNAPSGGPLVQHALVALLEMHHQKKIKLTKIVEKACHNPAILFDINRRGYIREGYFADLVLVDLNAPWTVQKDNIYSKCGWSPFEGTTFRSRVTHTFVNGNLVYENFKFPKLPKNYKAERLSFNR